MPGHRGGWKALLEVWWDGPGQTGQERPVPEVRWLLHGPGTPWASFRCGLRCCHVSPAEAIPSPTLGIQGDLPESSWGCWPRGAGPAGQGLCGGGSHAWAGLSPLPTHLPPASLSTSSVLSPDPHSRGALGRNADLPPAPTSSSAPVPPSLLSRQARGPQGQTARDTWPSSSCGYCSHIATPPNHQGQLPTCGWSACGRTRAATPTGHMASCPGSSWALGHTWAPSGLVCWALASRAPAHSPPVRSVLVDMCTRTVALGLHTHVCPRHAEHLREGV